MEPTDIRPGVRIAFLRGPEGVSIELLERKPWPEHRIANCREMLP